jgi:threonine dehydratase
MQCHRVPAAASGRQRAPRGVSTTGSRYPAVSCSPHGFDMPSPQRSASPDLAAVEAAAARIAGRVRRTPVLASPTLDAMSGAQLHFKCENLQLGGAFKLRGASNAVWSLDAPTAARGVATHSSGNHGTALALAARARGIPAHVVVPEGAVRFKVSAIEAAGAIVHRCAPTLAAREATTEALLRETGAVLVHPYADAAVIAGQGTAALELFEETGPLDALVTPIGGGGLASGSAIVATHCAPEALRFAAEPAGAADAWHALRDGERPADFVPDTVCDGLRALVGLPNLELLREHQVEVLRVDDTRTLAAMRLIFDALKLVVEPSAAIALAAVLGDRERFAGRRVGIILSGGNVDLDALPW